MWRPEPPTNRFRRLAHSRDAGPPRPKGRTWNSITRGRATQARQRDGPDRPMRAQRQSRGIPSPGLTVPCAAIWPTLARTAKIIRARFAVRASFALFVHQFHCSCIFSIVRASKSMLVRQSRCWCAKVDVGAPKSMFVHQSRCWCDGMHNPPIARRTAYRAQQERAERRYSAKVRMFPWTRPGFGVD
jgi:hypothetical protein